MFSLVHPQRAKGKKELLVVYAPPGNVLDFLSHSEKNKKKQQLVSDKGGGGGGGAHTSIYWEKHT